jgi:hypothetical protein
MAVRPGGHLGKATISAVTPELMPGSSPNFNHRYITVIRIYDIIPGFLI